jgi:hypothetical protein
MRLRLFASLLLPLAVGCAGAVPASEPEPAPPGTDGREGQAGEEEGDAGDDTEGEEPVMCDEVPVPASLVAYNVASTDYSGFVRIDSAEVVGADGGPPEAKGYVNHRYRVAVLETLRGDATNGFVFLVMADADIEPLAPGKVLFVSLCKGDGDTYYSPDNGYVFPAPDAFADAVRRLEIPASSGEPPTACEQ